MQAVEKVQPVEIGAKDFERLGRLFRAADYCLRQYRMTDNSPALQVRKASWWAEYQSTLAELMEALNA